MTYTPNYGPLFQPGLVAKNAPQTSKDAAASIDANTLRARVLDLLRATPSGLTDEEMQQRLGMNPSTQRPRRIELVDRDLVCDSGTKRATTSGRQAIVWKANTPA